MSVSLTCILTIKLCIIGERLIQLFCMEGTYSWLVDFELIQFLKSCSEHHLLKLTRFVLQKELQMCQKTVSLFEINLWSQSLL